MDLALPLAVSGLPFLAAGLYLLILALASLRHRPALPSEAPRSRLAVVVPAHEEEALVGRCVRSLLRQRYPAGLYRVLVVADNCTDGTAAEAERSGARVMVRKDENARGKGRALRWAMDRLLAESDPPDAVVVVDADSVADPDLLAGRLFYAVPVPGATREPLEAALPRLQPLLGRARVIPPGGWHLTLAFLGQVRPELADEVVRVGEAAVAGVPPARLRLEGAGTFPEGRRAARVLWAGIGGDAEILVGLAAALAAVDPADHAALAATAQALADAEAALAAAEERWLELSEELGA
jgi:glycosyltransferase involved in cell wall biosynthesis